jgi:hypothetical protein
MNEDLKLYVWEDVLADYTSGIMFALARSESEARELILKNCSFVPDEDLAKEPKVYETPIGFAVWGGG